jgi:hypothetical protein
MPVYYILYAVQYLRATSSMDTSVLDRQPVAVSPLDTTTLFRRQFTIVMPKTHHHHHHHHELNNYRVNYRKEYII